jgi:uncharacterized protein YecT (DUF1311 family)
MMMLAMMLAAASAQDCRNAVTQSDMTRCAIRDFEAADAALNTQWKATLAAERNADARVEKDGRPSYGDQLLKAQRAWIAYRDEHCRSDGYRMRGGSAEPMLIAGCRAELTRARTKQLAALIEDH